MANIRSVIQTAAEAGGACDEGLLGFYCAVARQCYENDYVYSLADGEADRAQHLRTSLEQALASGQECPPLWPVAVGAYFPLHTLANAQALLQRSWPQSLSALFVQQVEEPAEERRLAKQIPALTEIDGEVSRSVRQQYEENPYPRWVKPALPQQHTLLAGRQPGQIPDVLIAGCGTGLSAITFAQQAPDARILAIDLSLASLGYAKRMAGTLGFHNIEFAQADITKAAAIGRSFDFIDVSGVLHHLGDPWQGWRALLTLLRPGGVMQVGLYSKLARQNVVAARALIAERGYRPIPEDIRRCREEILAAADGSLLKSASAFSDFFTTNECRDLIFHVQEHQMTLPEIKAFLAENGLQFTGFVLDPATQQQFRGALSGSLGDDRSRSLARLRDAKRQRPSPRCTSSSSASLKKQTAQAAIAGAAGAAALPRSQSRAARCATAISASDIWLAISRRSRIASVLPFTAARLNHLCAEMRSTGTSRPTEYIMPSSNSMSPDAGPSPSGAMLLSRISKRAITIPCLRLVPVRFRLPLFPRANTPIILRRFEWWFK